MKARLNPNIFLVDKIVTKSFPRINHPDTRTQTITSNLDFRLLLKDLHPRPPGLYLP